MRLVEPGAGRDGSGAGAGTRSRSGCSPTLSSPFADQTGKGSLIAAQVAAQDFAKESKAFNVEILPADHLNKPDIGATTARRWVDQDGVHAIVDLPNSGVALAVNTVMKEKNRTLLASGTATSDLRQVLPADDRAVGARHLGARQCHGTGDHRARGKSC
jgi:hypothetical protein